MVEPVETTIIQLNIPQNKIQTSWLPLKVRVNIHKEGLGAVCIFDFDVFRSEGLKVICAAIVSIERDFDSADNLICTDIALNPDLAQLHFIVAAEFCSKYNRTIFKGSSIRVIRQGVGFNFHWKRQGKGVACLPLSADQEIAVIF